MSNGNSNLEIRIATIAELAGAKAIEQQLERDIGKAKALGENYSHLEEKLKRVRASIAQSGSGDGSFLGAIKGQFRNIASEIPVVERITSLFSSISKGPAGVAAAGFTAVAAAAKLGASSLREYAEAEKNVAQLDAALAQTGQLTDQYRESLQALASQLQSTTSIADDEWVSVLTRLTQFGSTAETINQDAEAVKNLAGLMGGDLQGAAQAVSRALQGNFQMFSRLGIRIDESGSQAQKLTELYEELAMRGGGQLEAMSQTLTGQFARLKNSFGDLLEATGRNIASGGFFQGVLNDLSVAADFWAAKIGGTVPQLTGLDNANKSTILTMEESEEAARRYAEQIGEIGEHATETNKALTEQLARMQAIARQQDELDDAKMAAELATVDAKERDGTISTEQAIRDRSGIRKKFETAKFEREQALMKAQINELQKLIENNMAAVQEAETLASDAESRQISGDKITGDRADIAEKFDKRIKDLMRRLKAFNSFPAQWTDAEVGVKAGPLTVADVTRIAMQYTKLIEDAEKEQAEALKNFDSEVAAPAADRDIEAKAKREVAIETLKKKYAENNELLKEIDRLESELTNKSEVRGFRNQAEQITTESQAQKARREEEERQRRAKEQEQRERDQQNESFLRSPQASSSGPDVTGAADQTVAAVDQAAEVIVAGFADIQGRMFDLAKQVEQVRQQQKNGRLFS